jgi:hypothetical protein
LKKNEMKNILLLLTSISFLIGCAPEKTMNRKINGTWNLISISNKTLPDSLWETVDFSPEGRNGKITFHIETKKKRKNQTKIGRLAPVTAVLGHDLSYRRITRHLLLTARENLPDDYLLGH